VEPEWALNNLQCELRECRPIDKVTGVTKRDPKGVALVRNVRWKRKFQVDGSVIRKLLDGDAVGLHHLTEGVNANSIQLWPHYRALRNPGELVLTFA